MLLFRLRSSVAEYVTTLTHMNIFPEIEWGEKNICDY